VTALIISPAFNTYRFQDFLEWLRHVFSTGRIKFDRRTGRPS
jgi:hypothetical protein